MPIYDYCCEKCGKDFEIALSIKDKRDEIKCPHCKSGRVSRNWGSIVTPKKTVSSGAKAKCGTCHSSSCSSCH